MPMEIISQYWKSKCDILITGKSQANSDSTTRWWCCFTDVFTVHIPEAYQTTGPFTL